MEKPLILYNTLTRKEEEFKPIKKGQVGIYSCGPTVYNYAHIGNFRTNIFSDILKKSLIFLGYKVKHVMNITDVDDKTIRASQENKISLKEFTKKYEDIFFEELNELNIGKPTKVLRAAETIDEMVEIIKTLMKKGYAYKANDGVYFSIEKSKDYGQLAGLDKITKTKERIKKDEYDKASPQDFALWKFYSEEDGDVFWETELGKGRPGWHIECSAMSMKVLGKHFDIHTGAIDLIFPHHTNEIAQSECATGNKFVNYWLHAGFLNMKEGKMSKSLGNVYTLSDLKKNGFSPLDYRYLCLQTHWKKPLDFSFENLDAAKNGYGRLIRKIIEIKNQRHKGQDLTQEYETQFIEAINDNINMPKALDVLWRMIDDFDFDPKKKLKLIEKFDKVLGLSLAEAKEEKISASADVKALLEAREKARISKDFAQADILRQRIKEAGYEILDSKEGPKLKKI